MVELKEPADSGPDWPGGLNSPVISSLLYISETVMIVDYVQARESDLRRVDHGNIAEQTGDTRIDHRRAR